MSERTYITLPRSQRVEDYLEHGQSLAIMAAFANALYNALGVRFKEAPFTPAVILNALGKGKKK